MVRALNQVAAFKYVTADNAPIYRAVMQVFFDARQSYVIELRPNDVLDRLRTSRLFAEIPTDEALDYHLSQLVDWGNLAAAHDPGAVARLEDFYRKRFLYHLTAVGEAAHRAVLDVEATAGRSGSLQSTMLAKNRDALRALAECSADSPAPPDDVLGLLHDLHTAFDTLTEEANRFIGELDRSTAPDRIEEERFVLYKQALLAYISRFVEQLRRLADEIRAGIEAVELAGAHRLIELASRSPDLPPALGTEDPVAAWIAEQRARWSGVRAWFVGDSSAVPTVERLAEVAREAVVSLTRTLGRLNDRRTRPVDRAADFRALARWFTACPDDRAAHKLWYAAFGLAPARHFHLQDDDPDLVAPGTSWWDAPPVNVPIRLRTRGSISAAGRPAAAADHSLTRQWIAQKRRRERAQLQDAVRRFAGQGPLSFRELALLKAAEFDLLLALLDEALSAPRCPDGARAARTADGRFLLTLQPPPAGHTELVPIDTPAGRLWCLDYRLEVKDALAASAPRAAAGGAS